jgi:DNA-directed RNA polymerase specialized sigma24 family protein
MSFQKGLTLFKKKFNGDLPPFDSMQRIVAVCFILHQVSKNHHPAYLYRNSCTQKAGNRMMRITEWLSPPSPCKQYDTNERLFIGLLHLENTAILCVQTKALNSVRKIVRQYGLPPEQSDDILNQSTLIFLRKIGDGSYQFQNHAPSTYLIEVARRVALMSTRSKKNNPEALENLHHLPDPGLDKEEKSREATELVRQFLTQVGQPCEQIIRLHHIDGYSDEEVVAQKWTKFSTTDSLKMKRSDCMKKLIQLAQQWKTSNSI